MNEQERRWPEGEKQRAIVGILIFSFVLAFIFKVVVGMTLFVALVLVGITHILFCLYMCMWITGSIDMDVGDLRHWERSRLGLDKDKLP